MIINETDNLTVTDLRDTHTAAAVLGGGVKYYVSSHYGIRLDVRASISKNTARTVLDARPQGPRPEDVSAPGFNSPPTNPTFVFSRVPAFPSTLSGPDINALPTYSGTGIVSHTNITAGIFWRF